ncbi:MAG: hypothetical protein U5N86_04295 [Planctomycetota bacterium]|nr:hypothetical protein [Planctomycetota bacterium]
MLVRDADNSELLAGLAPFTEEMHGVAPQAYLCKGFACKAPTDEFDKVYDELQQVASSSETSQKDT